MSIWPKLFKTEPDIKETEYYKNILSKLVKTHANRMRYVISELPPSQMHAPCIIHFVKSFKQEFTLEERSYILEHIWCEQLALNYEKWQDKSDFIMY